MAENKTMIQYFEWYLPNTGLHWKQVAHQAANLAGTGINMVWLPPAYKGASGIDSVGYDVYDMYDLGEFNQRGDIRTKYGTKEDYLTAIKSLQSNGVQVIADVVLNHKLGADESEKVMVHDVNPSNRDEECGDLHEITAWTKFTFPGRADKYSDFHWNHEYFSGCDWDEGAKKNGIFLFEGKKWSRDTDNENGNYDFLMGADVDSDHPVVEKENINWGKWYLDTTHVDGFRLDAVKHISFESEKRWITAMRDYMKETAPNKEFFSVGEYWANDLGKLLNYINSTDGLIALFDVPLHYHMLEAATSNG